MNNIATDKQKTGWIIQEHLLRRYICEANMLAPINERFDNYCLIGHTDYILVAYTNEKSLPDLLSIAQQVSGNYPNLQIHLIHPDNMLLSRQQQASIQSVSFHRLDSFITTNWKLATAGDRLETAPPKLMLDAVGKTIVIDGEATDCRSLNASLWKSLLIYARANGRTVSHNDFCNQYYQQVTSNGVSSTDTVRSIVSKINKWFRKSAQDIQMQFIVNDRGEGYAINAELWPVEIRS